MTFLNWRTRVAFFQTLLCLMDAVPSGLRGFLLRRMACVLPKRMVAEYFSWNCWGIFLDGRIIGYVTQSQYGRDYPVYYRTGQSEDRKSIPPGYFHISEWERHEEAALRVAEEAGLPPTLPPLQPWPVKYQEKIQRTQLG